MEEEMQRHQHHYRHYSSSASHHRQEEPQQTDMDQIQAPADYDYNNNDTNGNGHHNQQQQQQQQHIMKVTRKPTAIHRRSESNTPSWWSSFRCFCLDLPLVVVFATLCLVFFLRSVWMEYYIPLLERARRTDEQLLDEYTYYERTCAVEDITTGFTRTARNATSQQALDALLMHGAVTVPDLLRPDTISKLRAFVRRKNRAVTDEEAFPVSQGDHRLSYGIEATEDDAVVAALGEITSHWLLPDLLEELLGVPDPALTELTAITAYEGCEDQVVHSDTKSDGYAGQFARTYSHSYSLFIPLQTVTPQMGVTRVCPGTHYCTNDLEDVCSQHQIGVHQAFPEKVWPAGQGFIINQQVWHGGSAHKDPQNPERILFIVSFIARPQLGKDTRQLARGTYFHMKWNMWGGTFRDIAHAASTSSMVWPWNVLRSLAVWKPPGENWGYNLLLSSVMRAANEQSGMEVEDLLTFVRLKMDGLFHLPKWLQGPVVEDSSDAWRIYIQETFDRTLFFVKIVSAVAVAFYFVLAIVGGIISSSSTIGSGSVRLSSMLLRPMITHGIVTGITWLALRHIRTSPWGHNILSGKTLMRPFPGKEEFTTQRWQHDPDLPVGRTTLPDRWDVLLGTRYDADYLGSYNQWLDYHPGNRIFSQQVSSRAYLYHMYANMDDPIWLRALIRDVADQIRDKTRGGRIIKQDYLTGAWVALSEQDSLEAIRYALAVEASSDLGRQINLELNFLVAEGRFGYRRGTVLALESTLFLQLLRQRMFGCSKPISFDAKKHSLVPVPRNNSAPGFAFPRNMKRQILSIPKSTATILPRRNATNRASRDHIIWNGSRVMVYNSQSRSWSKGAVRDVQANGTFDIEYADGHTENGVPSGRIGKAVALEEGVKVRVIGKRAKAFEGTVKAVFPNGIISVELKHGKFLPEVSPEHYQVIYPPFHSS